MCDGAIVYETVARLDELPVGWTDQQDGGRYRLERRGDGALFGYAVGPHSWKRFLHPPIERLWQARREENGFAIVESERAAKPLGLYWRARLRTPRDRHPGPGLSLGAIPRQLLQDSARPGLHRCRQLRPGLVWGDSDTARVGDWVMAIR